MFHYSINAALQQKNVFFHSCAVHLDTIESFIHPTDAQLDYSKNVKIYVKIYMRGAPTCFGSFTAIIRELLYVLSLAGSYYMCFAKAKHI